MEHLSINLIKDLISEHAIIIYFIILLGVIIEGEFIVLLTGVFASLNSLNIIFAFTAIVLGGLSKTFIAYSFGSYLRKRHKDNNFIHRVEGRVCSFLPNFEKRPFWSIFSSRFLLFGIAWFTLVFSGFKSIPFKIYFKAEILSLLTWSVFTIYLGYFFGSTALNISLDVRNFIILILAFLFLFFIIEKFIAFVMELFALSKVEK